MCVTVHSGLCRLSHCPTVPLTVLEIPRTCFCLHSGSTYRLRCVYAACASWWQKITVHLWHLRSLAATAAAAAVGFLLLVVSIYGKLLKLYGNLFACQDTLYVCVRVVHLVSLRVFYSCYCFSFIGSFGSFSLNTHTDTRVSVCA